MKAVTLNEFKAPAGAKEKPPAQAQAYAPTISVPMQSSKKFGDGTPVNTLMTKQRREVLKDWFGEKWRDGAIGTTYKAWLYCVLSVIAVIIFYSINLWVTAVFAYLAGFFWSEILLNYAWSVEWFKGKALIETK